MTVTIKDNVLIIAIPMQEKVSASGKSITIATTSGNKATDIDYKGKKVVIGVNAYIPVA